MGQQESTTTSPSDPFLRRLFGRSTVTAQQLSERTAEEKKATEDKVTEELMRIEGHMMGIKKREKQRQTELEAFLAALNKSARVDGKRIISKVDVERFRLRRKALELVRTQLFRLEQMKFSLETILANNESYVASKDIVNIMARHMAAVSSEDLDRLKDQYDEQISQLRENLDGMNELVTGNAVDITDLDEMLEEDERESSRLEQELSLMFDDQASPALPAQLEPPAKPSSPPPPQPPVATQEKTRVATKRVPVLSQ